MSSRSNLFKTCALVALLTACGGGGDCGGVDCSPVTPRQPPDLSGVWAGAWQGQDPVLGLVTGTWENTITQGATLGSGTTLLLGDVDCMDGQMEGGQNAQGTVSGTLQRPPCAANTWALTALDTTAGTATGSWTQPGSGAQGTLGGVRIARLDGPRIRFVHPAAGAPGALVTVVGERLDNPVATAALMFGTASPPALESASATRLVARVPAGASTAAVKFTGAAGVAWSPMSFETAAPAPALVTGWSASTGGEPLALAVSPDGRKVYVAQRTSPARGAVAVVHVARRRVLSTTVEAEGVPRSVVASPDGQRIYVAVDGVGVRVMDAAVATVLGTIATPLGDGALDNPQGLAISPDGALLAASDGLPGGAVGVWRTADRGLQARLVMPAGQAPLGVVFAPDGERAWVVAADTTGLQTATLRSFDPLTGAAQAPLAVGALPTGIAVTPDGAAVFVASQAAHTVSRVATASGVTTSVPVNLSPTALVISPDGTRVYVVSGGANAVQALSADTGLAVAPATQLASPPRAIAMHPRGGSAYLTTGQGVLEVGGRAMLTVARAGSGYGSVNSSPGGIACGTACQASFPAGTVVTLTASPDAYSNFTGWSGDADCSDGQVTVGADLNCVATFTARQPPPSASSGGGCFIATAAYGRDMAPQVQALRDFRDRRLLPSAPGRAFVAWYYRVSPPIAELIRPHASARAVVRAVLAPVVFTVMEPASAAVAVLAGLSAFVVWRRARRPRLPQARRP